MKKILMAGGSADDVKDITACLEGLCEVAAAPPGAEAAPAFFKERPPLIIADASSTENGGFELIERLHKNPAAARAPVLFLVRGRDIAFEARAINAGVKDFIMKPVERSLIRHKVEFHLKLASMKRSVEDGAAAMEDSLISRIADIIECRDADSDGHVSRISGYVGALAGALMDMGFFKDALSEEDVALIVRAAPLHDVGKIAISDRYLLKPDRLDDEEFAIIKKHAEIGAEILGNMYLRMPTQTYLKYARLIAASHHERFDGKGYPYRLAEDEIPLCGRIMAVADVYDALVCDRAYRKGFNHAQASGIIAEGRGTQFDPRVVDAFDACRDRFAEISSRGRAA
jgi:putative two-component system response regulator